MSVGFVVKGKKLGGGGLLGIWQDWLWKYEDALSSINFVCSLLGNSGESRRVVLFIVVDNVFNSNSTSQCAFYH